MFLGVFASSVCETKTFHFKGEGFNSYWFNSYCDTLEYFEKNGREGGASLILSARSGAILAFGAVVGLSNAFA